MENSCSADSGGVDLLSSGGGKVQSKQGKKSFSILSSWGSLAFNDTGWNAGSLFFEVESISGVCMSRDFLLIN